MFKRLYIATLMLVSVMQGISAQGAQGDLTSTMFPYPQVPEDIIGFTDRADYFVSHFWDECRLKSEFSSRQRFAETFDDYAAMLPHASAETALASVDALIARTAKTSPANLLTLCGIAEQALYDGNAGYVSDALYLPFAKAAATARKIPSADKARFVHQARVLGGTQPGMVAPDFKYTDTSGSKRSFAARPKAHTLLFVNDPDCDDCRLARVRLAADYYIKQYVSSGELQVFSIYPGEYSAQWAEDAAASSGDGWVTGACATLDDSYDLRTSPTIYYLDRDGKILSKTDDVDALLEGFYNVYSRQHR